MEAENDGGFWDAHERARASDAGDPDQSGAAARGSRRRPISSARLAEPLRDARAVFYPTLGLGFVSGGSAPANASAIAAAIEAARRSARREAAAASSCTTRRAPVRARLDVWGVADGPRSAVPLMRNLKQRLDPERRLAPGRFVAGI